MKIQETEFDGLYEIFPEVYSDTRGYFVETFRSDQLSKMGLESNFVQDNQSFSKKNVIRGLHMQLSPHKQIKLVRAITGSILDIVVDLRPESKTYLRHYKRKLDSERCNMLYIPGGFAHGIAVMEDAIFGYKCTDYYNKESEVGISYEDKELNIDWELDDPILSEKDQLLPSLQEFLTIHELA